MAFHAQNGRTDNQNVQVSFLPFPKASFEIIYSYALFYLLFNLVVPRCGEYVDCLSCASDSECAWCASENQCTTIGEAFSMDCRGLVFDPPCPSSYVSDNIVVGNLIVRPDPTFGGGTMNISGMERSFFMSYVT
jgi:hypothetical protein